MGSLSDYWGFFWLVEEAGLRSVVPTLMGVIPELVRGGYPAIWVVLFLLLWETVLPWRRHQRRLREGVWLDLFYTFANLFLVYPLIASAVFQTVDLMFRDALHGFFGVQLSVVVSVAELPRWLQYVVLLLMTDLLNYLGHVLLHRSSFLWTFHSVHHSSRQLDVLNAVRLHWVEKLYYDFFSYVPMMLVGFGVQQILIVRVASLLFCAATHANIKLPLGPLKYVVNNPQLHLWHHAAAVPHDRNVNYGSVLSLWDSLFRTLHLPDDRNDVELGFPGVEHFPTTLWRQQLRPLDRLLPRRSPTGSMGGARPVALQATLCVLFGVVVAGQAIPEPALLRLGVGHRERASELLAQGEPALALAQLDAGALLDEPRVDLLQRLQRVNQAAQFASASVSQHLAVAAEDARLRFRIGTALLAELSVAHPPEPPELTLFERAVANARLVVRAEPRRARSHYLMGRTRLLLAEQTGSPRERSAAIRSLERALAMNPEYPGARVALAEAKRIRTEQHEPAAGRHVAR